MKTLGLTLLAKETIPFKEVAEYVIAVNEYLDGVDEDARLQRAMENSQKQLEYIFSLVKEFKK